MADIFLIWVLIEAFVGISIGFMLVVVLFRKRKNG